MSFVVASNDLSHSFECLTQRIQCLRLKLVHARHGHAQRLGNFGVVELHDPGSARSKASPTVNRW